jgi:hypothetical protein
MKNNKKNKKSSLMQLLKKCALKEPRARNRQGYLLIAKKKMRKQGALGNNQNYKVNRVRRDFE